MHDDKPSGFGIREGTDNDEQNHAFLVRMLRMLLLVALMWTAGCDGELQAPSASDTPSSTNTRTPTPSATQLLLAIEDLKEELLFSGGGGDGAPCPPQPEGVEPPAVTGKWNHSSGFICLYGFPPGESIQVQLLDPAGKVYGPQIFLDENSYQTEKVIQIMVWFPGLPSGDLSVEAHSPSLDVNSQFKVEEGSHPDISVVPASEIDTFEGDGGLVWWIANAYLSSEEIRVLGSGFPPGSRLPLGIYKSQPAQLPSTLAYGQDVSIDDQGRFDTTILLEPFASIGAHCAVVIMDPEYQPSTLSPSDLGANQCFVIAEG